MNISLDCSTAMLSPIGTGGFGRSLMTTAHEMVAADYCSLFLFEADQAPVCLASNGLKSDRLAYYAADKYISAHWRDDPTIGELALQAAGRQPVYSGSGPHAVGCASA